MINIEIKDFEEVKFGNNILYGSPFLLAGIIHFAFGCNIQFDSNKYNAMELRDNGVLVPTIVDFGTPIKLVKIKDISVKQIEYSQQEDLI
jgi:hypothetical protein